MISFMWEVQKTWSHKRSTFEWWLPDTGEGEKWREAPQEYKVSITQGK